MANRRPHPAVLVPTALVVALVLVAAACGGGSTGGGDAPLRSAPFTAARLGGGEIDSSALVGTDTVLWFWAPWCTVCRAEAPNVVAAAGALEGSVQVVGVAGRGEVAEMEAFVSETGTGGLDHLVDGEGVIWADYGVVTQPTFAFIDDGGDVEVVVGAMGRAGLEERMRQLAES